MQMEWGFFPLLFCPFNSIFFRCAHWQRTFLVCGSPTYFFHAWTPNTHPHHYILEHLDQIINKNRLPTACCADEFWCLETALEWICGSCTKMPAFLPTCGKAQFIMLFPETLGESWFAKQLSAALEIPEGGRENNYSMSSSGHPKKRTPVFCCWREDKAPIWINPWSGFSHPFFDGGSEGELPTVTPRSSINKV